MHTWIDNTGLHAAYACLEGKATDATDVKGLLQLALLLIFSEQISLNGFEHPLVAERTEATLARHTSLSLVKIVGTRELYAHACKIAAEKAATEIALGGIPTVTPQGLAPSVLAFTAAQEDEHIRSLLLREMEPHLEDLRSSALDDQAAGAVKYMLATSETLREELRQEHSQRPISIDRAIALNAFLRYHLNNALAGHHEAAYAPSVARATLVRFQTRLAYERLGRMLDKAIATHLEKALPSGATPNFFITQQLVERAKGDPVGILEEAIRLRDEYGGIRKLMGAAARRAARRAPHQQSLDHELRDIVKLFENAVGKYPRLRSSIDFNLVLFAVPSIRISVEKAMSWLQFKVNERHLNVLTELSADAANSPAHPERVWERLMRTATRAK